MGFFDEFQDTASGAWVGKDEKQELMENGVAFPITEVTVEDSPQYGERYVTKVILPNEDGVDEERLISFPKGSVESRDRMLDAMAKYLEADGAEKPVVTLEKVGRSIIIRAAA
jgi:hypothetical protein